MMKLTAKQKKGIRTWLQMDERDEPNYCPFLDSDIDACLEICPVMFPKLRRGRGAYLKDFSRFWCPCNNYTLAHVKRVARKAVGL